MAARPLRQTLVFPILILLVAGGLALWSRQQAPVRREMAATFVADALAGRSLGKTHELVAQEFRQQVAAAKSELTVEIREGDGGPAPDGSASHVAILRRDGLAWLGLRLRVEPDPTRSAIVGIFRP
jgi:hypothetical protein